MKKPVNKIICGALATVVALGISAAAGCSGYRPTALGGDYSAGEVVSNGGFAVEKGDYVYFINGVESNTANNTLGVPVKGAIMRISTADLKGRNYALADMVVPTVTYSQNYETGIFVYGDYVYYSTPSTTVISDGSVQNTRLELKSAKLDGTGISKNPYITFDGLNVDFRFVEDGGTVYVLYAATSETLYGESTGVTNLHSINTATGENTLLAYNVKSYLFDAANKSNPKVYYTMSVTDYSGASNTDYGYNQVYCVSAADKEPNEYDFDSVEGWNKDNDRYINCGDLVLDGIGGPTDPATVFNFKSDGSAKNNVSYTYTLKTYTGSTLFYTRTTSSSTQNNLFTLKDADLNANYNPVTGNPARGAQLLDDGSAANGYKYLFDAQGNLQSAIYAATDGGIIVNKVTDGKLCNKVDDINCYRIVKEGTATVLFTDGDYLYYSLTGGNGYTFYRINYTGSWDNYAGMFGEDLVGEYTSVKILDLDADSSWYMPELLCGHILFASETDRMTEYNYIMAFDIAGLTQKQLDDLNKKYSGINGTDGIIPGYSDTDKYPSETYANFADAARYLFYTSDIDYIKDLAVACNAELEEDADPVYSDNTLSKLEEFITPSAENDWKDYVDTKKVNGVDVNANTRDYYYSVLGRMSDADKAAYTESFRSTYLRSWPVKEEVSWYDSLPTVAKVFFIIGMCLIGLLVIGGITVGVILIVRKKRRSKEPVHVRRRINYKDEIDEDLYADNADNKDGNE